MVFWLYSPMINGNAISETSFCIGIFIAFISCMVWLFWTCYHSKSKIKKKSRKLSTNSNVNLSYATGVSLLLTNRNKEIKGDLFITDTDLIFMPDSAKNNDYEFKVPLNILKIANTIPSQLPSVISSPIKVNAANDSCCVFNVIYTDADEVCEKINLAISTTAKYRTLMESQKTVTGTGEIAALSPSFQGVSDVSQTTTQTNISGGKTIAKRNIYIEVLIGLAIIGGVVMLFRIPPDKLIDEEMSANITIENPTLDDGTVKKLHRFIGEYINKMVEVSNKRNLNLINKYIDTASNAYKIQQNLIKDFAKSSAKVIFLGGTTIVNTDIIDGMVNVSSYEKHKIIYPSNKTQYKDNFYTYKVRISNNFKIVDIYKNASKYEKLGLNGSIVPKSVALRVYPDAETVVATLKRNESVKVFADEQETDKKGNAIIRVKHPRYGLGWILKKQVAY